MLTIRGVGGRDRALLERRLVATWSAPLWQHRTWIHARRGRAARDSAPRLGGGVGVGVGVGGSVTSSSSRQLCTARIAIGDVRIAAEAPKDRRLVPVGHLLPLGVSRPCV
jgi:hypothetical protein